MTTYTLSYFIKGAKDFEEGATVVDMGNGWFCVVKTFESSSQEDAIKHATSTVFPIGSAGHMVESSRLLSEYIPPKPKRKAAWKQSPLARYTARGQA